MTLNRSAISTNLASKYPSPASIEGKGDGVQVGVVPEVVGASITHQPPTVFVILV